MFTGPHTEGPCGNPRKALGFLAQLKLGAVSAGARSCAAT